MLWILVLRWNVYSGSRAETPLMKHWSNETQSNMWDNEVNTDKIMTSEYFTAISGTFCCLFWLHGDCYGHNHFYILSIFSQRCKSSLQTVFFFFFKAIFGKRSVHIWCESGAGEEQFLSKLMLMLMLTPWKHRPHQTTLMINITKLFKIHDKC